jgi:hypothetical protein
LSSLYELIERVVRSGCRPEAVLLGGSFIDTDVDTPKDIDGCLFFSTGSDEVDLTQLILDWQGFCKQNSIDIRFVPYDMDPIVSLKCAAFIAVMYTQHRPTGTKVEREALKPCMLLSCRAEGRSKESSTEAYADRNGTIA